MSNQGPQPPQYIQNQYQFQQPQQQGQPIVQGQQPVYQGQPPQQGGFPPPQQGYPLYPQVQQSTAQVNYTPPPNQSYPQTQPPQQPYPQQTQPYVQQQYAPLPQQFSNLYNPKNAINAPVHVQTVTVQKKGGLFSGITKQLERGLDTLTHEVDKVLVNQSVTNDKFANDRFKKHFNLPPYEGLFFEIPSKAATLDTVLIGHIYLSYSYLSFYVEFMGQKSAIMIPLRDIVGIQRAMVGKSVKETLPNIVPFDPINNKLQDTYVMEVYTNIGKVHQFFSIPSFEATFQTIESTWKNCNKSVAPPLPLPPSQPLPQQHPIHPQTQPQVLQTNTAPVVQYPNSNQPQVVYVQQQPVYTTTTTTTVVKGPIVQNPPVLYPNSKK